MTDLAQQLVIYAKARWLPYGFLQAELVKRGINATAATLALTVLRDRAQHNAEDVPWETVESDVRKALAFNPPVEAGEPRELVVTHGHGLALFGGESDIHFYGQHLRPGPEFNGSQDWEGVRILGPSKRLLFEEMIFDGYGVNANHRPLGNKRIEKVTYRRCMFINAWGDDHAQGMFSAAVDDLSIEECLFASNGEPSNFSQGCYITNGNTNVSVVRSIFADSGSYQLQLRCGGSVRDNLFIRSRNGLRLGGGGDDGYLEPGVDVDVSNNVFATGVATHGVTREGMVTASNIGSGSIDETVLCGPNSAGGWPLLLAGDRVGIGLGSLRVTNRIHSEWPGVGIIDTGGKPWTGLCSPVIEKNVAIDMNAVNAFLAMHAKRGLGQWGPQYDVRNEIARIRAEIGA